MLIPDNRDELRRYDEPAPYFGQAVTALLEGMERLPGCEIHIVCAVQRPLFSPLKIGNNIYYHSVTVPKWGWMRGAYIGCARAIRRKLREINPDLVHGQGTERYCALAAVFSGYPNVLTIHGNMRQLARVNRCRPFSFGWLAARLEQVALPRTSGVFCNSQHTERLVKRAARRTWLVPNALGGAFFSMSAARPAPSVPVLLNIGLVSPNKSQIEILSVAESLYRRGARFELHFIGALNESTPYDATFRERISRAEKEGFARYLGQKRADELIELMDAASGLIHAPAEEAFGLVAAEALARNLKFFGAKVGGLADIAAGVEGVELFESGDWERAGEAVYNWLRSGHQKPTQAARQMRERYHPDCIALRHLEIYREILTETNSRAAR